MNSMHSPSAVDACWNQIGILGDRSCPKLLTVTHCRNCSVYSAGGRQLLEREVPESYRQEWTALLSTDRVEAQSKLPTVDQSSRTPLNSTQVNTLSVVIFRLRSEWFALPAPLLQEVTQPSVIHTLPHRSNEILLGLVNIRGELQLCISLAKLLNLETASTKIPSISPVVYPRLVVMERESSCWVFPVDEIYGVQRIHLDNLKPPPASVARSTHTYTKGLILWKQLHVNYLDDELLFYTLDRRVLQT